MVTKAAVEQRGDMRVWAGSDPAHTAKGVSGVTQEARAFTPLMLDAATGKLVKWDGQNAGTAVGVLALALTGTESTLTYYKSGTFATETLVWPDAVDAVKKANAFAGSALSHA